MKIKTVPVLADTDVEFNVVSNPIQAGGYYSMSDGKHKLVIYTGTAFVGRIILEGTLEKEPTENDWFNIPLEHKPFVEFPIIDPKTDIPCSNNKVFEYEFTSLATFIRVKLDREYLKLENPRCFPKCEYNIYGNLRKVLLSY